MSYLQKIVGAYLVLPVRMYIYVCVLSSLDTFKRIDGRVTRYAPWYGCGFGQRSRSEWFVVSGCLLSRLLQLCFIVVPLLGVSNCVTCTCSAHWLCLWCARGAAVGDGSAQRDPPAQPRCV